MRLLILTSTIVLALSGCDSVGSGNNMIGEDKSELLSDSNESGDNSSVASTSDSADKAESDSISAVHAINANNYASMTKQAVSILNLHTIDEIRLAARDRSRKVTQNNDKVLSGEPPSLPGLSLASQTPIEGDGQAIPVITQMVYVCENAGTLTSRNYDYGEAPYTVRDVAYDNCLFNNLNSKGRHTFTAGRRTNTVDTFSHYQTESDGIVHSVSGTWEYPYPWFGDSSFQSWTAASFTQSDATDSLSITDFNWSNMGVDSAVPKPDSINGYVVDAEGIVRPVQLVTYQAHFTSSFTLNSTLTDNLPITVNAELQFKRDYFVWREDYVDGIPEIPDYPVSDLGSPLTLSSHEDFDSADMIMMIDQQAQDRNAQWQTGQLRLIAGDGSEMVLRPDASEKTQVQIKLNDVSEPITALWSDGYQIDCVSIMEGCGRDEPRIR